MQSAPLLQTCHVGFRAGQSVICAPKPAIIQQLRRSRWKPQTVVQEKDIVTCYPCLYIPSEKELCQLQLPIIIV